MFKSTGSRFTSIKLQDPHAYNTEILLAQYLNPLVDQEIYYYETTRSPYYHIDLG